MQNTTVKKLHIFFCALMTALIAAVCSTAVFALSAPSASGQIDSFDGAILRSSPSTESEVIIVMEDDTAVRIHKEVFRKKYSTSKEDIWYYVSAEGKKGYVRADLVDNIRYKSVRASVRSKVYCREGAGTGMKSKGILKKGKKVSVVLAANPVRSAGGSSLKWYKIRTGSSYSYVCSSKIRLTGSAKKSVAQKAEKKDKQEENDTGSDASKVADKEKKKEYTQYVSAPEAKMTDKQFEAYLKKQGFPKEYRKKLRELHKKHPDWGFTAFRTGIKWSDALAKQTKGGVSLVSAAYPDSYRDGSRRYEPGWCKASKKTVAYYMDPRNFLNENGIYMFEDLSYKPAYQSAAAVGSILSASKLPSHGFKAGLFVNAAEEFNVSPVFLASRARQETGSGGAAVNGTRILGKKVYNPFNIGAFGGANPLYKGLLYAYAKGWNTPALAVNGGAEVLAENYISQGQYTVYYQRFNVRNGADKAGTHQYMTNIMAHYSEARSTKDSYSEYGITDQSLVFEIPVYTSMPSATRLP